MDRQTFLTKLLESKNVVRLGKGWSHCSICKEKFGDQSDGIGEPEVQVSLPCHKRHTMGSYCIIKWLEQHNTCPICRQELFPAEVAEDGGDEDDEDDEEDEDDEYDEYDSDGWDLTFDDLPDDIYYELGPPWQRRGCKEWRFGLRSITELCEGICDDLGFTALEHPTKSVAYLIASYVWYEDTIQNDLSFSNSEGTSGNFSFAAACVYTATWLSRQPISGGRIGFHKRSMTQIAEMYPGISKDSIRLVYRTIYDLRDKIVTVDTIHEIAASDVVTGRNRFPVWRWRTKRSRDTSDTRELDEPTPKRRREINDRTH